jgi:hypothetical protein
MQFCQIEEWLKAHEYLAVWLEGVALFFILFLELRERGDRREDQKSQDKLNRDQLAETAKSADAAKRSADLTAALHRPYVAVSKVVLSGERRYWNLNFEITNYGMLPAFNVNFSVKAFVDREEQARIEHHGPSSIQLFTSSSEAVTHQFDFGDPDGIKMREGQTKVRFDVEIFYELVGGSRAVYTAEIAFDHPRQKLKIAESNTTTLE